MSGHHHHHIDPESGDRKVIAAVGVNVLLTVVQIVGGLVSGSLALIADAVHNFSDAMALVIAFAARKIGRRPADDKMTFGYGRAEVVAALVNYTTLIVIGIYLAYESVLRFINPEPIDGWIVVIVAVVALVVDLATAGLTYALSKESVNIRAAFLHNLSDALGSVAVIVGGSLVLLYDWTWIDPVVTALIAAYILWLSFVGIVPVIRILMLGVPDDADIAEILEALRDDPRIIAVHHAHLWAMEEHTPALEAHIEVREEAWSEVLEVKRAAKARLRELHVKHATLEFDIEGTVEPDHEH